MGQAQDTGTALMLASWLRRASAQLFDALLWVALLFVGWAIVSSDGSIGSGAVNALVALWFVGYLLYGWLMIGWRGQTLGKIAVGIHVVRADDGNPPGYGRAGWRCVATGLVAVVPFGQLVDVLLPLSDRRRQTIHDKLAKTVVVRTV